MIAGPQRLLALRRHPLQVIEGNADLVGVGALGLFDCRFIGVDQAVRIGAVEIGVGLIRRLECCDEFLVLGRIDFRRIADAGNETFRRLADGTKISAP